MIFTYVSNFVITSLLAVLIVSIPKIAAAAPSAFRLKLVKGVGNLTVLAKSSIPSIENGSRAVTTRSSVLQKQGCEAFMADENDEVFNANLKVVAEQLDVVAAHLSLKAQAFREIPEVFADSLGEERKIVEAPLKRLADEVFDSMSRDLMRMSIHFSSVMEGIEAGDAARVSREDTNIRQLLIKLKAYGASMDELVAEMGK